MHPGWVDTPGVTESLPVFRMVSGPLLRPPEEGADTAVWLATLPDDGPTGRARPEHYLPFTRDSNRERQSLWQYCADAIGLDH